VKEDPEGQLVEETEVRLVDGEEKEETKAEVKPEEEGKEETKSQTKEENEKPEGEKGE